MITDEMDGPNGICFSPDYKKVYIADTGTGRDIRGVRHWTARRSRNGKRFVQLDIPGERAPAAADGIRCDVDGNIWCGRAARRADRRAERRAHRHDPAAGKLRQHLLRRARSATGCSWPPANPSMRCTWARPAHTSPKLERCFRGL